jgi:hypothetical protein
MKIQRFLIALTVINLGLLVLLLATRIAPAQADSTAPPVVRARAFQLVDERGRVRASLNVMPGGTQPDGTAYPETVLLRLITEQGRPSVKVSASEQSSGLSFAGPTGTKDTYAILESGATVSSLQLRNEDGKEQIVRP